MFIVNKKLKQTNIETNDEDIECDDEMEESSD